MQQRFRQSALITCMLAALLACSTTSARQVVKWNFLNDSVYSELSAEDWEALRATAGDVLNNGADGTSKTWRNPETGANGEISVLSTTSHDGLHCRWTRFLTVKETQKSRPAEFLLCRVEDGTWKFATLRP